MRVKFLFLLGFGLIAMASCKKCITCEYTNRDGQKITTNETCGNKDDRADFEQGLKDTWGEFGDVTCNK